MAVTAVTLWIPYVALKLAGELFMEFTLFSSLLEFMEFEFTM